MTARYWVILALQVEEMVAAVPALFEITNHPDRGLMIRTRMVVRVICIHHELSNRL